MIKEFKSAVVILDHLLPFPSTDVYVLLGIYFEKQH